MSEPCGWNRCPADVLLSVFSFLDDSSLSRCLEVNSWWRDLVDYYAQHNKKWPAIAQNIMANSGTTFIKKSWLDWRELYINYALWHHIEMAQITCNCVLAFDNINYIHVYKDFLTVVYGAKAEVKCLKINEAGLKCLKDTSPRKLDTYWPPQFAASFLIKKMIQAGPFKRVATFRTHLKYKNPKSSLDEDAFYALDGRNNLDVYIHTSPKWFHCNLARYYGQDETLDSLEAIHEGIRLHLKNGVLLSFDKESRCLEQLGTYYRPHKRLHSEKICKPIMPDAKDQNDWNTSPTDYARGFVPNSVAFEESGKMFVGLSAGRDEVRWSGECPELTSATQHGDMLLLGYDDGKIEIFQINFNVSADPSPPKLCFNIRDYATKKTSKKADFRVLVIELYELKESHRLLVATPFALYSLVITYPEHIKHSCRF